MSNKLNHERVDRKRPNVVFCCLSLKLQDAGVAQLIERRLAKAKVAGLSPVSRSKFKAIILFVVHSPVFKFCFFSPCFRIGPLAFFVDSLFTHQSFFYLFPPRFRVGSLFFLASLITHRSFSFSIFHITSELESIHEFEMGKWNRVRHRQATGNCSYR